MSSKEGEKSIKRN